MAADPTEPIDLANIIDGEARDSDERLEVHDPATRELVGSAPDTPRGLVDGAVAAARAAGPSWAADPDHRLEAVAACANLIDENLDRLSRLLVREQGKPLAQARGEVGVARGFFQHYSTAHADLEPRQLESRDGRRVVVESLPLGVVGAIAPWNFPLSLMCAKIAPALAAGNTVVAKPAPTTPLSSLMLVGLLQEVLPPGVLNCITGGVAPGTALVDHPDVRKIAFTGSVESGRAVMRSSARHLKRLTLELGGNDPAIVTADADVGMAAHGILDAAFRNAGQTCISVKRVYVHEDVATDFTDALQERLASYVVGHGLDEATTMGPLHTQQQLDYVVSLVNEAEAEGASVLRSAKTAPSPLAGWFMEPVLLLGSSETSRIVRDEQFGPALPIQTYSDEDLVIAACNAGEYGLGGSVWSSTPEHARRIARRFEAGTVWINQHGPLEFDAPFGGWKSSGLGRERGTEGLREYVEDRVLNERTAFDVAP